VKLAVLLLTLLLAGCGTRTVTETYHAVAADQKGDPVGYFAVARIREEPDGWWCQRPAYDRKCGTSDIRVEFRNTTAQTLTFDYRITGRGWQVNDAVISLPPGHIHAYDRRNLPYDALDWWRVYVGRVHGRSLILEAPSAKGGASE
jgi:hypothetical protein